MEQLVFINLPVKDLPKSREFFGKLGFSFNQQFSDDTAACMIISSTSYAMLLTEEKFRGFTNKPLADARLSTEVLISLSCESRRRVDEMVALAVAAGASLYNKANDYGFMYGHGFQDLDGHIWEVFWMDPTHVQET